MLFSDFVFHYVFEAFTRSLFCFYRYVLLKEKNMLQTMEMECNAEARTFPNPERIDKVSPII